jgi:hypothetical protein
LNDFPAIFARIHFCVSSYCKRRSDCAGFFHFWLLEVCRPCIGSCRRR